jgi:2-oxo-3-hexenedioate decarboxylase/2-keto-4-pentenoate hydratase
MGGSDDRIMFKPGVGGNAMDDRIEEAAAILADARIHRVRLAGLPARCRPEDEAAAYRVQDRVHAMLDAAGRGAVVGHKIGCTTRVMQDFLGIANPCAGSVLASMAHRRSATLAFDDFLHVGVECEIAVSLARDLPPRATPHDIDEVARAIRAYLPAIEVVDDRWTDYRRVDTPTLIADDFFHAACVLGEPVEASRAMDLAGVEGVMHVNGAAVGQGRGADVLGHPHAALAWLANALASRGRGLKAGQFVLTGSVVATKWVERGDRVRVSLTQLGDASVEFA